MESFIEFGRGPLFRIALAVAILGLGRHAVLSTVGLVRAYRKAGDKRLSLRQVISRTAWRLNPLRYFFGSRWGYSILSFAFHLGIIMVPVFYAGHIRLWHRGLGVSWPALALPVADVLTIISVITGVLLVVGRLYLKSSRKISKPVDWLLPPLISIEMLTGYFLAHPGTVSASLDSLLFVHVWLGDLLLLLTPFTKIAHCTLLPFTQLVAEMSWRMVPGCGREVARTLGREGKPI